MTFADFVNTKVVGFVDDAIIPLLFALAFLAFLTGVLRYFFFEGEENKQKGRQFALWGMIGLVVMFGVWGIVKLIIASVGAV